MAWSSLELSPTLSILAIKDLLLQIPSDRQVGESDVSVFVALCKVLKDKHI